jgi:hypothetical protein
MVLKKALLIGVIAVFSLLLNNIAYADLVFKKYSLFNNSGGLNDSLSTTTIADGESTDLQNIVFDVQGAISKRFGYQNVGVTTTNSVYQMGGGNDAVTALTYYVDQTTGNKYIVAIANVSGQATGFEKQLDSSNNIPKTPWVNIGSVGLPAITDDQQPTLTDANNILVITFQNSSGVKPLAWVPASGNIYSFSSDPNEPNATISDYYDNILFLAGDPANPARVTFSDLTNGITHFVATDFFDIDKLNGHHITALIPAFGNNYIFEDNSIWMLSGSSRDSFVVQKMVDNVGTLSPHSVSVVNNNIFFITSQNDIAIYDGTFSVKFISSKIRNTIGANNFNRAPQALGIGFSSYKYKDLDYYVAETVNGVSQNNQILMFDTNRESWTRFINFKPDSWTIVPSNTGQDKLVFGDYNGVVYSYPNINIYDDPLNTCTNGTCTIATSSIYSYYQTKWFTFSDSSLGYKRFRVLKTYIQNSSLKSTLSTQLNYDYNIGSTVNFTFNPSGALWGSGIWGSSLWGGTSVLSIDREEPNLGQEMFQLKYSNNNIDEDMTILGWDMYIEPTSQL